MDFYPRQVMLYDSAWLRVAVDVYGPPSKDHSECRLVAWIGDQFVTSTKQSAA